VNFKTAWKVKGKTYEYLAKKLSETGRLEAGEGLYPDNDLSIPPKTLSLLNIFDIS